MRESRQHAPQRAIKLQGSWIPGREQSFTRNRITVARALWPHKTAAHLAAKAGCSERAAKFYLAGRDWSARAIRAIVSEIF